MNTFTYDEAYASRAFIWLFDCLYDWLIQRKWNKETPTVESSVVDANYTLTVRKYTEEMSILNGCMRTIKIFKCRFILIS